MLDVLHFLQPCCELYSRQYGRDDVVWMKHDLLMCIIRDRRDKSVDALDVLEGIDNGAQTYLRGQLHT